MQQQFRVGIYGLDFRTVEAMDFRLLATIGFRVKSLKPAFLVVEANSAFNSGSSLDELRLLLGTMEEWAGRPASGETIAKFFAKYQVDIVWLYK